VIRTDDYHIELAGPVVLGRCRTVHRHAALARLVLDAGNPVAGGDEFESEGPPHDQRWWRVAGDPAGATGRGQFTNAGQDVLYIAGGQR